MEKQIAMSYPTPIGKFLIPDAEAVNHTLRNLILSHETIHASNDYANVGGWHSNGDLLEWPDPAVATLKAWILEAVAHVTAVTTGGKGPAGMIRLTAWANVSRKGNYHRVHNHPSSNWSGVYYVDAGGDASAHPLSGVLELCDPRPFTEMIPTPGNPFGQRAIFRAEAGSMILFPGWLYHFVNPFYGEGQRISVAFNVRWVPPGERGGAVPNPVMTP
ncbi:MAG TPA: TIGR02466 family protein [Fimbriiglobus sp.]